MLNAARGTMAFRKSLVDTPVSVCYSCGVPTSVRYQREPLTDSLWDDALPLLVDHWAEVSGERDVPLRPSLSRYETLAAHGVLRVFTARTEFGGKLHDAMFCGDLVGYALFTVIPSLNTGIVEAQQGAIYVTPSHRPEHGKAFVNYCTDELFSEGVELVYQTDTAARPLGRFLQRQGFELAGQVWVKERPKEWADVVKLASVTTSDLTEETRTPQPWDRMEMCR